jgi:hypothetical protein
MRRFQWERWMFRSQVRQSQRMSMQLDGLLRKIASRMFRFLSIAHSGKNVLLTAVAPTLVKYTQGFQRGIIQVGQWISIQVRYRPENMSCCSKRGVLRARFGTLVP